MHLMRFCCLTIAFGLLSAESREAQPLFTDITQASGIRANIPGEFNLDSGGIAVADYDNDGRPDIFLSEWFGRQFALLHNEGNGRFAAQTDQVQLDLSSAQRTGTGILAADFDNDGDADLFVPLGLFVARERNRLLRNDRGVFVDITAQSGFTDERPTIYAVTLDYDGDGWLDLFTVNHFFPADPDDPEQRPILYRNTGGGRFVDVTAEAGLDIALLAPAGIFIAGLAAADFNGDGRTDLLVGVEQAPSRLFLNNGDGTFRDGPESDLGILIESSGVAAGDIDNDGDLDVVHTALIQGGTAVRSRLLLNQGDGTLFDITESAGLQSLTNIRLVGSLLADIDNDGDLDLMANTDNDDALLYLNEGDGTFRDATMTHYDQQARQLTFLDANLDGFLDAFGSRDIHRGFSSKWFYHHVGNDNHWLRIDPVGVRSNRDGIGARIYVESGGLRQMREIIGGHGAIQQVPEAHFGLGQRDRADRVEIHWPSGQIDVLEDIAVDRKIRVIEGQNAYFAVAPTIWAVAPPEVMATGTTREIALSVRPGLFEPTAEIAAVTADLSQFGGDPAVPLTDQGDGTYRLDAVLQAPADNIRRTLAITIDERTALGPQWIRLSKTIPVNPAAHLPIWSDALSADWQLNTRAGAELPVATDVGPVLTGTRAAAVAVTPASNRQDWHLEFSTNDPIKLLGFSHLSFAFHPGNVVSPENGRLNLFLESETIELLGDNIVDLQQSAWQQVDIPLTDFYIDGTLGEFRLSGTIAGTFYLDDIRLVTKTPPPATAVLEEQVTTQPESFALDQNFPNPFNSGTIIRFDLPQSEKIELAIYNLAGQKVATIVQGLRQEGSYEINWDGRDHAGRTLASGVYFYRLQAGARVQTRKLLFLR